MRVVLILSLFGFFASPCFAQQAIQVKVCAAGSNGFALPCTYDKPVTPGNTLVRVRRGGCDPNLWYPLNCGTKGSLNDVLTSQGDDWLNALVVGSNNGVPLDYVIGAKGGVTTVYVPPNTTWNEIILEYPPVVTLDGANTGSYRDQNVDTPQGQGDDIGWTLPVETSEPNELIICWDISGEYPGSALPQAGPFYTIEAQDRGQLAVEDMTSTTPGLYFGTMAWENVYGHWSMGVAAFKVKK